MTTLEDARTPAPARLRKRFAERFGNAGARPLAFASAPGPVSYTHLPVYDNLRAYV